MLLGFADGEAQARALAQAAGLPFAKVEVHRFPDGESRVTLPPALPSRIVIYRSLHEPNDKLIELLLAVETARGAGVDHVTLVAPYLCYMRQDAAFHPGEAVSQRIIGRLLGRLCNMLVTVDPHLHRVATLSAAVPSARAVALSAAPAMGAFLAARGSRALLLGPDEEALQWVACVGQHAALDFAVAHKQRHGDRSVEVVLPERDYRGADVVLVDDVASTGRTLAAAAAALVDAGAARVDVLVTHALFVADAESALRSAGVTDIWSSDSISHRSNAFALARELAQALT